MGRTHPNLRGHWRFENNLTDTSGNGKNASVFQGSPSFIKGKIGQGREYNRSNGDQTPTNIDFAPQNSFGISFWIKPFDTESNSCPFGFANTGPNTTIICLINRSVSGDVLMFARQDGGASASFQTGSVLSLNEWHFVFLAHEGSNLKIYVDAGLKATQSRSIVGGYSLNEFGMGLGFENDRGDFGRAFNGQLDDVQIWNRALAPHQIAAIYNGVDPAFIGDIA